MRRFAAFLLVLVTIAGLAEEKLEVLYIANGMNRAGKGGLITAYRIDRTTGSLSAVIGSPFDAGLIPYGLATDNGKNLYLANPALDDNNLRVFPIRADTGRLETEHTSTFEGSNYEAERNCCPGPMLADRSGRFAYVGNTSDKTISVYDIFPGSLALTQLSKVNTRPGHFPVELVWGPNQGTLFAFTDAGLAESLLHIYRRDPQKGSLTEATGSPMRIPYIIQLAATDDQLLVLTTSPTSSQLKMFSIAADATLTAASPLQLPANEKPFRLAVDPANKFVALAAANKEGNTTLSLYALGIGKPPSLASTTTLSCLKACTITSLTFDVTGKFLYVADTANEQLIGFSFSTADITLKPIPGSPWKSNFQPHSLLAVAPK
jgi:DNA-binding beta-propeller fold protein YncE